MDEPFDRRRSRVVVGGVEEHGPLRLAISRAREGVRGERAECLYVVPARGEQGGDHRAGRLSFGKRPDHLPALVEPERVGGVDDDLVLEQAPVLCDQFLGRVEPDGEDDGSASAIASSTEAARASSPSSCASAAAFASSLAARTTGSPPRTRCRASVPPMLPVPMIAVATVTSSFYLTPQLTSHTRPRFPLPWVDHFAH